MAEADIDKQQQDKPFSKYLIRSIDKALFDKASLATRLNDACLGLYLAVACTSYAAFSIYFYIKLSNVHPPVPATKIANYLIGE